MIARGTLLIRAGLIVLLAGQASAQQPSSGGASVLLPADHWAVAAARRLARLGVAPARFGWGDGALTAVAVGRLFAGADADGSEDPELAALVHDYRRRFEEEFPATARVVHARSLPRYVEGFVNLGYATDKGRVLPGRAFGTGKDDVGPPEPLRDQSDVRGGGRTTVLAPDVIGATASVQRSGEDWTLADGHVLAAWRGFGAWIGRRRPHWGPGVGGGLLFNGVADFDAVGVALTEPLVLPWLLRYLGPIRFESFVSRLDSNATVRRPWVLGSHVSVSPHPRLLLGASMGAMFGGDSVAPVTLKTLWSMFTAHGLESAGTEFENGLASFEIRYQPPLGDVPLVAYLEWAAEDNHEAWLDVPGRVIGLELVAVPGLPQMSLGVERTTFARACDDCKFYAMWYRHYLFVDGWTQDRIPIGHPLGGDGSEWLAYATWDDPSRGVRLTGRVFERNRGTRNAYSPTRNGRSAGASALTQWRIADRLDVLVEGSGEWGRRDWSETSLSAQLRWLF
jgi:hypothetical protein